MVAHGGKPMAQTYFPETCDDVEYRDFAELWQGYDDAVLDLARREGVESYLIDGAHEIDPAWVAGKQHIGLTAGASAPQVLVDGVIERLRELGAGRVGELDGEPESMVFALPKELRLRLVG